jgi:tRNA-splicing ligase RtcB
VLNPDGHAGYGAPVGCVLVSPTHIYPGPVGVDIKCSMSFLQLDLPADQITDKPLRRALINAIMERTPTGPGRGQRSVKRARPVDEKLGFTVATEGASPSVCNALGIPLEWAERCEDAFHVGHDGTKDTLVARLDHLLKTGRFPKFAEKITQLGSYGGGNHFGECELVQVADNDRARKVAAVFGLRNGCIGFLSHCGSRGFGNILATNQFAKLGALFSKWGIPFPAQDKHLVYAPLGTDEANIYLDDMAMGARRAVEALQPGAQRDQWLSIPYTGVDGVPATGQAWVQQHLLAATIITPPLAGLAIELLAKAMLGGQPIAERTIVPPVSYPPVAELRPAAASAGA